MDSRVQSPKALARPDDRFDEVWDGVRVVSPYPNNQHQRIATRLSRALLEAIEDPGLGVVLNGANVSDRHEGWGQNYRGPDIAVYLEGTTARDWDSHWEGGPDFAVEIVSPNDRSREKLEFYASVGVREVLFIDRKPWMLELSRAADGVLASVGSVDDGSTEVTASDVLPLSFRLVAGSPRPTIEVIHVDGVRRWTV